MKKVFPVVTKSEVECEHVNQTSQSGESPLEVVWRWAKPTETLKDEFRSFYWSSALAVNAVITLISASPIITGEKLLAPLSAPH